MQIRNNAILAILLLLFSQMLSAQSSREMLCNLAAEKDSVVAKLIFYPEATRKAILTIAQHPSLLVRSARLQEQSGRQFIDMIATESREVQEAIWDMTRYPGLIDKIAEIEPNERPVLEGLLASYSEAIHERARKGYDAFFPLIKRVSRLNAQIANQFVEQIAQSPSDVQAAMQELIESPELLTLLNNHLDLTILLGELYQTDTDWLMLRIDSLHLEYARQNAAELADWKERIESDPTAAKELAASASDYASEYAYDDEYYDDRLDEDAISSERNIESHYHYHYPYWYSYPYWYDYPRWQPYPWWYEWGFYYHSRQVIVVWYLPRYHIVDWYFHRSYHHYRYNRLSTHFVNHYYGHRSFGGSSIVRTVDRWKRTNRAVISEESLQNPNTQRNHLREIGEFERSRQSYNQRHPKRELSQTNYLDRNARKYPTIQRNDESRREVAPRRVEPSNPNPRIRERPSQPKPVPEQRTTRKPSRVTPPKIIPKPKPVPSPAKREATKKKKKKDGGGN